MLFKRSNLNSNLALTLGHLNPALKNTALKKKRDCSQSTWIWVVLSSLPRQQGSLLRGGLEAGEKEKESTHPSHRPPRTFYFCFRLLLFLQGYPAGASAEDREAAGFETGRRISFGSLQLENTAEIQATRAIAQALSEHVETFLSSTVEKCFALAKKLDQILQHCKSIWTRNLFIKKNFTKVALIRIFANINEFIIVKEQLIWLYQILLANISRHCCPSYIGLVTFFTYLEATHLSVFHRCSTRSSCNIQ